MTLDEFITHKGFKPLTEKEISNGKSKLRIYGTNEPMPWTTIYTRIASGQDIEEIVRQYGHARKLTLFAQLEGIGPQAELEEIVAEEANLRKRVQAVANKNPEAAQTLMDRVNEIAPDFSTNVAMFADEVVTKARKKLTEQFIEATDILALTKAVQTVTDSTGHTTRHASQASTTNVQIQVAGFTFDEVDMPPEQLNDANQAIIDVTPTILQEDT
jgi:hypothetical protein